jgi:hypothetical protein
VTPLTQHAAVTDPLSEHTKWFLESVSLAEVYPLVWEPPVHRSPRIYPVKTRRARLRIVSRSHPDLRVPESPGD